MKHSPVLWILAVLSFACTDKHSIMVKGKLQNPGHSFVYFQEQKADKSLSTDSLQLDESGTFKFRKKIDFPTVYSLWVNKRRPVTLLVMPGERVRITGRADSLLSTVRISGSMESELCLELTRQMAKTQFKLDSLNKVYQQYLHNPNINNIRNILTNMYDHYIDEQRQFVIHFVDKHPGDLASIVALYQQIDKNTLLLGQQSDVKYFEKADIQLNRKYPKVPLVQALHANVIQLKEQLKALKMEHMLSILNEPAPDIALPDPKGDTIRLSSFKGKVVLLDFWASWCPPCRAENYALTALYQKYKSKGFAIFQVSLDKNKDSWVKAIHDDKLVWAQCSDLKYWDSPAAKRYNVDEIPATFVIDRDGKIVAKDLTGEDLENKISELLGK